MLLEQERMDNMRLAELQKLRLAAELEMIQQLEEQQREQEEIALAGAEYEYQNTARGRGVKAKAGEQLNRGLYEKQQREERGEPPLLISANTTKEDKRRHIKANKAEHKRKRKEAQQEATALAVYNNKKEQYYKSAKLSPGAGPTNTLPLSLTRLDAYIQHMKDDINARHSVMVASKPPASQILARAERKKKLCLKVASGGLATLKGQETGSTKSNVLLAGQMLRYEKRQPHPDKRKIRRLTKYIKDRINKTPTVKKEERATATHNKKKEHYYKNVKLMPGIVPTRSIPLSMTRLDKYMEDEIRKQKQG